VEIIFDTKEEARRFLLSGIRPALIHSCYMKLKPYDKYNVLEERNISIFVEYYEHYVNTNMWGRWVEDMNSDDVAAYENEILNGT